MNTPVYTPEFYSRHADISHVSAQRVLRMALQFTRPDSLLDVGCGIGTWLAAARDAGVSDYFGVDGDYVQPEQLLIDPTFFQAVDLTKRFNLGRRFDMAICLEVAEHLPAAYADAFIASLATHSDVILFSAAIPHQLGENHVNCQWPFFWYERFERYGYECLDCLRRPLWDDSRIAWYYRQNMLLYVKRTRLPELPILRGMAERGHAGVPMPLVHPAWYLNLQQTMANQLFGLECKLDLERLRR